MRQDKKVRAEYLSSGMAIHDEATRLEEAIEAGSEEGEIKGKVEITDTGCEF